MKNKNSEISNNDNKNEFIDTLNKVIFDVNLLIEKIKALEDLNNSADREIFKSRDDIVDLKADDVEIKKNIDILSKEAKILEHETRKLGERTASLESKTKTL